MAIINIIEFSINVASVMGNFKAVPKQAHRILFLSSNVLIYMQLVTLGVKHNSLDPLIWQRCEIFSYHQGLHVINYNLLIVNTYFLNKYIC